MHAGSEVTSPRATVNVRKLRRFEDFRYVTLYAAPRKQLTPHALNCAPRFPPAKAALAGPRMTAVSYQGEITMTVPAASNAEPT